MKKLLATILSMIMVLSLCACGNNADSSENSKSETTTTTSSVEEESKAEVSSVKDSLELLDTVWNSYGEDEKFSASGGDTTEGNMTGPGNYGIEDTAALDSSLAFPAAEVGKIDGAASLVHMMNANSFTCGAFHCKSGDDVSSVATAIKDNIAVRQWICGFPEKLCIVTVDDYVVSFFGATDLVDTFKTKLTAAYTSANVITDENIE